MSRNSPGGQEKLSTFSRVTITWLGKGILCTIDYWLWNTFLTKWRDWHYFWLSAGTLYSWYREKSFWICFIYTLEGCVLGCTYFFFEKVYFWNTLQPSRHIYYINILKSFRVWLNSKRWYRWMNEWKRRRKNLVQHDATDLRKKEVYSIISEFKPQQFFRRRCSEAPRGSLGYSPSPSTASFR